MRSSHTAGKRVCELFCCEHSWRWSLISAVRAELRRSNSRPGKRKTETHFFFFEMCGLSLTPCRDQRSTSLRLSSKTLLLCSIYPLIGTRRVTWCVPRQLKQPRRDVLKRVINSWFLFVGIRRSWQRPASTSLFLSCGRCFQVCCFFFFIFFARRSDLARSDGRSVPAEMSA